MFSKFPHLVRVGLLIFVEIPGDGQKTSQSCLEFELAMVDHCDFHFFVSNTPSIKPSYQALNSLSGQHMYPSTSSYILSLRLNHQFCGKVIFDYFYPLLHRILSVQAHIGITKIIWACNLYIA